MASRGAYCALGTVRGTQLYGKEEQGAAVCPGPIRDMLQAAGLPGPMSATRWASGGMLNFEPFLLKGECELGSADKFYGVSLVESARGLWDTPSGLAVSRGA